jgi:hypothetical protein
MATKTRKPPRAPRLTLRQKAADKNPLYNLSQILSGHRLSEAADAIVNTAYAPKLSALDREAKNTRTQGTALAGHAGDYYAQLAGRSGKALEAEGASLQALRSGLANTAASSDAAAAGAQQSVMDRLAADRAQRGGDLAGGGDQAALDELAAQRARSGATAGAYQASGELQGARSTSLMDELAASTQARGGEVQQELGTRLANALADVRARRADLDAQRADERTKQLTTLRQQGYDNLVTQEGLGLKQSQLAADVANQQAQVDLASQRISATERHNLATERNQRSGTRLQAQSLSERERHNQVVESLGQLRADIQQQRADQANGKGGKPTKESQSAINIKRGIQNTLNLLDNGTHSERYLRNKVGVPPDVMQAAKDLKNFGYLQYDTVNALKTIGVRIPKKWQPPAVDRSAPH